MTKKKLFLNTFLDAYGKGELYYAIAISSSTLADKEIITNSRNNILDKISYWNEAYNDDLELISNADIKITDYIASSNIYLVDDYMRYWLVSKR